ncbi:MAG: hypothetical protein H0W08_19730 [Acidobacteria bacterium]|nr:hypothetical protein [Acidobacteriota bacterium]
MFTAAVARPGLTLLSALLVGYAVAAAQPAPTPQTPAPQIATPAAPERGADLVGVDFTAVSPDGRPLADLKASEISVRIGGKRRAVRSVQLISIAGDPRATASLPPAFATNDASDGGRSLVILIDDDSFQAGREAAVRGAVDALIARLSDRDRLSLVTMPYGGVKVPLTTDHTRVRTALMKIVGQSTGTETGSDLACRTRRTLESLAGYLDSQQAFAKRRSPSCSSPQVSRGRDAMRR